MIRVVDFKTEYRVGKDPIDWVLVAPMGAAFDKTKTWHRVSTIDPARVPEHKRTGEGYHDMKAKWSIIGPAYDAYKTGSEIPETGTPLEAWSGVTKEQVKVLKTYDVRTVEDVRDMGDATMSQLRIPNVRQLPKLAADYLSGASMAEKDAEIAEMRERMAAMEELLEERTSDEKPKRGRPRKENEAA